MPEEQPEAVKSGLSREQKMGFVFLLVFAIIGIILGILQIRNTIFAPFALTDVIPNSIKESVNDVEALKYRDTDVDGLSDYDETYEYGTSPYLYDSFGYGMSDKEVVEKGYARCANAGKNCTNENTSVVTVTSSTPTSVSTEQPTVENFDINSLISDPKQLRELLVSNGMDKDILNSISDNELLLLVNQLVASSTTSTSTR